MDLLEHSFIVGTRWNTLEQIFQKYACPLEH